MKDCDFLPLEYHLARAHRRAMKLRAACVGGLVAVMVIWLLANRQQLAVVEETHRGILSQHSQLEIHMAQKSKLIARRGALRDHSRLIQQLANRVSSVGIFADISNRLPATVVLTQVSLEADTVARYSRENTAPSSRRQAARADERSARSRGSRPRLILSGLAATTPALLTFAAELESSPVFSKVHLDTKGTAARSGRRGVDFELTCQLASRQRNTS